MTYILFNFVAAIAFCLVVLATVRPQLFKPLLKQYATRKALTALLAPLLVLSVVAVEASTPQNVRLERQQAGSTITDKPSTPQPEPASSPAPAAVEVPAATPPQQPASPQLYTVTQVVDGDTIKVDINGKQETIRMIGLDTPETKDPRKPVQCYGYEASSQAVTLLQDKRVRLESDETQDDRDKYDRLLRYVYTEDGTLYNQIMIANGFAYEYTYGTPYKFQAQFKAAQNQAKATSNGLWSANTCGGDTAAKPAVTQPVLNPQDDAKTYANCKLVRSAGLAPLLRGQMGYSLRLDGDRDGIACE